MSMLTTIDNPWNPYTHFTEWYLYDTFHHYNTCMYIDRIAEIDPTMPDIYKEKAVEDAIDRICDIDPCGLYVKLSKPE